MFIDIHNNFYLFNSLKKKSSFWVLKSFILLAILLPFSLIQYLVLFY